MQNYSIPMREYIRTLLTTVQPSLGLTQPQMANLLGLDVRSYNDLINGKSLPSAATLVLLLTRCCSDSEKVLGDLAKLLENPDSDAN